MTERAAEHVDPDPTRLVIAVRDAADATLAHVRDEMREVLRDRLNSTFNVRELVALADVLATILDPPPRKGT